MTDINPEQLRLQEDRLGQKSWRKWGPYLSERQWGTVREDYTADGNAWNSFSHDQARSRAYRWGEDGLAGWCDDQQRLCLALALWNGQDPILKERLFGLPNGDGNHGEDCKELYYYLDGTPTNSYLKMLYKYPQGEFPYARLVEESRRRGKHDLEFELLDSGIFGGNRYFDVFVEYAKAAPDDVLLLVTAHNRSSAAAELHLLPQLWFRNTWAWKQGVTRPLLRAEGSRTVTVAHPCQAHFPEDHACDAYTNFRFHVEADVGLLFCENDTNRRTAFGSPGDRGYFKDGVHEAVVGGRRDAVNPDRIGTKVAAHHHFTVPAGGSVRVRVRLSNTGGEPFADFDAVLDQRRAEADAFFADIQRGIVDTDARLVQRQAFAGFIWSRQYYYLDIPQWLAGDPAQPPPPPGRKHGRNRDWAHLNNADVVSMPDKWEYPYYCVWDTAFHCLPVALIDPDFAKKELLLFLREWYMHPNGQIPAYEWNFSDVNPPVHVWAAWRVFETDRAQRGGPGDLDFLERVFHKFMLNFTWWVNRKDAEGRNVFQGGFLGMDNIGVFDRSAPLPTGGHIDQADGTAWMAMYCLNLMRIALELARHNRVYEDVATKFFEHFLHIAEAMTNIGEQGIGLWDPHEEFFYDVLRLPDGNRVPLKVRSLVGLTPLFAVEVLEPELLAALPDFDRRLKWYLNYRPDLAALVSHWNEPGRGQRRLLSLLRGHRMKALLRRMLDETEFLSDFGVRSVSARHRDEPFSFDCCGMRVGVSYVPGESDSGMFGGNSNWRGPIWFPMNYLLIESLRRFHAFYGNDFKVECPTGSGNMLTLSGIADELCRRLARLFLRGPDGCRPCHGDDSLYRDDPHFRDLVLFYEHFHGDTGRGIGTTHQTGWTGAIARLMHPGG